MKFFYRFFACAILFGSALFTIEAFAVPAKPGPITVVQPDGSKLTIRLYGDEFANYTTTDDGYGIYQAEDGFYYYLGAASVNKVRAKDPAQRTATDRQAMNGASIGVPYAQLEAKRNMALSRVESITSSPDAERTQEIRRERMAAGEKFKSIVILVNFQDVQYATADANNEFSRMLNEEGYSKTDVSSAGSAWDYYNENSMGVFDPQFDVYGPYTVSKNMAYYGAQTANSYDIRPEEMVVEACQLAHADGLDFSQYADNGTVRDIFIFYAGYAQSDGADSNTIWPHRYWITAAGKNLVLNGVRVDGYACASELRYGRGNMAGIGTFCHEYGHVLGLPDYYATNYNKVLTPSTYFLMDGGSHNDDGRTPPSLSAINRFLLGWIEPEVIDGPGNYELPHISENKAYIIRVSGDGDKGEYFTLETRSSSQNKWDEGLRKVAYVYGSGARNGMLIMHIDRRNTYLGRWTGNSLNNTSAHPCAMPVTAVEPTWNSSYQLWSNQQRWFFPQTNVTTLSEATHADFKPWSGSHGLQLSNIKYDSGKVTFTVGVAISGVSINEQNVKLITGQSKQLTATVSPEGVTGYELQWTSGDHNIATVDNNGIVTSVSPGSATITVTVVGSSLSATTKVNVESALGDITQLYAYQNDAEFRWTKSSDESVTGYKIEITNSSNTLVYSEDTQNTSVYIPYLIPGKAYTIKLMAMRGSEALYNTVAYFSTMTSTGEYAYMNIKGTYGSGESVPLHIFDIQGEVASIVWKVDGTQVTAPSVSPGSGRHEITATVTTKDNQVETITKFVTIQ